MAGGSQIRRHPQSRQPDFMNPRVILTTGGNGGLGRAIARSFLQAISQKSNPASAVRFLACPEAICITGSALKMDSGIF
jgi:hypothetical protein